MVDWSRHKAGAGIHSSIQDAFEGRLEKKRGVTGCGMRYGAWDKERAVAWMGGWKLKKEHGYKNKNELTQSVRK
jgi:hypothetical protein